MKLKMRKTWPCIRIEQKYEAAIKAIAVNLMGSGSCREAEATKSPSFLTNKTEMFYTRQRSWCRILFA